MSGLTFMRDCCDIKRRGEVVEAYGSKPEYTDIVLEQVFWYREKQTGGVNALTAEYVITTTINAYFPPSVDVREGDLITNVFIEGKPLLRKGSEEFLRFYVVDGSLDTRGHATHALKVCQLEVME